MQTQNGLGTIPTRVFAEAMTQYGTPCYLYDENLLIEKCRMALSMPNAWGLRVRYAMKANSNRTILRIIDAQGILMDASSMGEVKRALLAGIGPERIMLTTQEVPEGQDREELERLMRKGLRYNVCSLRQLQLIGDFTQKNKIDLSIRIHPGVGAGESSSRNTGDKYSCFGVHLLDVGEALGYAESRGLRFTQVHVHIGSGGDPELWRQNIDRELSIVEEYFPHAETISFGGGLKVARMPDETAADIGALGLYAKRQLEQFFQRTNRKCTMEIEPGTFLVANCGYAVTKVVDKKRTDGFQFIILDGGMDINARPLLYGSRHPFYVIGKDGGLLSSEFDAEGLRHSDYEAIVVGRCCESGDSLCLDSDGNIVPRKMAEPDIGDLIVIGGSGAYCSAMAPFNYNSHLQIPEVLILQNGEMKLIRKKQSMRQIVANEM